MSPLARIVLIACIAMVPAMSTPAFPQTSDQMSTPASPDASDQKFTPERGKCVDFLMAISKSRGIVPSELFGNIQPWNVCAIAQKHGYEGPVN